MTNQATYTNKLTDPTLAPRWRWRGPGERLLVLLFIGGVGVAIGSSAAYGAAIAAIALGLLVLVGTGTFSSRYQRTVCAAVGQLYDYSDEERHRDNNLQILVRRLEKAPESSEDSDAHACGAVL